MSEKDQEQCQCHGCTWCITDCEDESEVTKHGVPMCLACSNEIQKEC